MQNFFFLRLKRFQVYMAQENNNLLRQRSNKFEYVVYKTDDQDHAV